MDNRMHNKTQTGKGPQTSGATLHRAAQYDLCSSLIGTGVNGANSRMVIEMAQIKPGDKVLDVGCGTGSLTLTAKKYAGPSGSAYGIDASPQMIEVACKKARSSAYPAVFEVGLIEQIAYPAATFDIVISRLVIHHLPDDVKRRGFTEIWRVLKPGGRFFVADFNKPSNSLLAQLTSAMVHHGMLESNVWVLPAMLSEAGFVDVSSGLTRSAFLAFVTGKKPATGSSTRLQ